MDLLKQHSVPMVVYEAKRLNVPSPVMLEQVVIDKFGVCYYPSHSP